MPNPIVTLDRDDLYDRRDANAEVFLKAYKKVVFRDLRPGGHLWEPYIDTRNTPNAARSRTGEFTYTRYDNHFEEVMVYYQVDCGVR